MISCHLVEKLSHVRYAAFCCYEALVIYIVPELLYLAQIGLTGSIYLTISISVEKYTTVVYLLLQLPHNWSAKNYVTPTAAFALIYIFPNFQ